MRSLFYFSYVSIGVLELFKWWIYYFFNRPLSNFLAFFYSYNLWNCIARHINCIIVLVQWISDQTDFEYRFQITIAVVKQFLNVIRKRKKVTELDSDLSEMVDSYVLAVCPRLTIFSRCKSPFPAVEADNTCIFQFDILGLK